MSRNSRGYVCLCSQFIPLTRVGSKAAVHRRTQNLAAVQRTTTCFAFWSAQLLRRFSIDENFAGQSKASGVADGRAMRPPYGSAERGTKSLNVFEAVDISVVRL